MIKNLKLTVLVLLAIITFTSCSTFQAFKAVNLSSVKLGMTKEEVQTHLKKTPDNIVAAKNYPETNSQVEVVQYSHLDGEGVVIVYWLYFVNNKLDKWEIASKEHRPRI